MHVYSACTLFVVIKNFQELPVLMIMRSQQSEECFHSHVRKPPAVLFVPRADFAGSCTIIIIACGEPRSSLYTYSAVCHVLADLMTSCFRSYLSLPHDVAGLPKSSCIDSHTDNSPSGCTPHAKFVTQLAQLCHYLIYLL